MSKSGLITGLLCAFVAAALPQAVLAQTKAPKQATEVDLTKMKPSATVTLEDEQISLIFGGQQGKGVLHFQGKQYPFTIKGLTAGASIGMTKIHAIGNVYALKKAADFSGKFSAIGASATAVKGAGASSYQNDKGVYLTLTEKSSGAALTLGVGVMDIKLGK
jgi:hypothetical protein